MLIGLMLMLMLMLIGILISHESISKSR